MAYLYVGLGMAMMVGIVSIFETATSFDQAQLQWSAPDGGKPGAFAASDQDAYLASIGPAQALLRGASPPACKDLPSELDLAADYTGDGPSGAFRCVVQKAEVVSSRVWIHRILIDSEGNYWSCIFDQAKSSACPFE